MNKWINKWINETAVFTAKALWILSFLPFNPLWFIAHWSVEIALSKSASNPFITKPNRLDISVAFENKFFWNSLYYGFLEERTNLVFPCISGHSISISFSDSSYFTQLLICLMGSSFFDCYATHPEMSTVISRWMSCKRVSISSASSWVLGWPAMFPNEDFTGNPKFTMIQ